MISIGNRLRTQEKLRQNEEFFKNMFNESAGANFLADLNTLKTVSCNKKAIEIFEADDASQLIGVDTQLFQVSTFSKEEMEAIKTEVADNWGWSREIEFKTLKGQVFWGNLEYRVVQFQNKPFMQIRITDISDRKRLEHLLMAEKEVLELASQVEGLEKPINSLFANIEDICSSIKCAILFYDEKQQSLSYGYSNSLNRNFINNIEKYSMSIGTGLTNTAALTLKPVEINQINSELLKEEYGSIMNVNHLEACHAYPILSEDNQVLGVLAVYFYNNVKRNGQELEIINRILNICRVLIEKEKAVQANKDFVETLQVKNEELRKTNEELDRFVYSTSHDLRVPLTNVMGLIEITNMTMKEEAPKKYLDMMRQSVVALDDVIRGILDYSRNSRSEVTIEEVRIKEMVAKIRDMLKYYNGIDNIDFRIRTDENIPLYTDKHRLMVILSNLISNAVKYYNKNEKQPFISIVAQVTLDRALIFVEDNGIGIPEEYQQKVFDMFYRASSQSSGSGLGLYILKETLSKVNGKINVISGRDIGSTFVVEIPNHINEQQNKAIA
jgi:PAS domain S-box-containing protein